MDGLRFSDFWYGGVRPLATESARPLFAEGAAP
jgi:hypothetical protein